MFPAGAHGKAALLASQQCIEVLELGDFDRCRPGLCELRWIEPLCDLVEQALCMKLFNLAQPKRAMILSA
jgi:hypothetical protein